MFLLAYSKQDDPRFLAFDLVSIGFLLEQDAHTTMTHVSIGFIQSKMILYSLLLTCL